MSLANEVIYDENHIANEVGPVENSYRMKLIFVYNETSDENHIATDESLVENCY